MAVAKTGSFKKASLELFVSQPTISRQVSALEEGLGYRLFTRTTRKVDLTPEGKVLYNTLLECSELMEQAHIRLRKSRVEEQMEGILRIGFLTYWLPERLNPPFIPDFFEKNPNVKPYYESHSYQQLVTRLKEDRLDFIVIPIREIHREPELSHISLGEYPIMAVISKKSPLAKFDHINDKLDELPLYTQGHDDMAMLKRRLARFGIHSDIIFTPNVESKVAAAENGLGYTIVLSCSSAVLSPKMRAYTIDESYKMEVVLAYKSNNADKISTAFIDNLISLKGQTTPTAEQVPSPKEEMPD